MAKGGKLQKQSRRQKTSGSTSVPVLVTDEALLTLGPSADMESSDEFFSKVPPEGESTEIGASVCAVCVIKKVYPHAGWHTGLGIQEDYFADESWGYLYGQWFGEQWEQGESEADSDRASPVQL